jgi:soluble lytic murein transglycosylase-like protein
MYGIANTETNWKGPFDYKYKSNLKSHAGALGPMQIMPSTAKTIIGKSISNKRLQNDIQLNVRISAILLKRLYEKYTDWKLVFGAYNTGKPCINKYSKKVYQYQPQWSDSVVVNLNKE